MGSAPPLWDTLPGRELERGLVAADDAQRVDGAHDDHEVQL